MAKNKKELTGAQVLLKTLQDSGVELAVGYTGGTIMPIFDKLKEFPSLRFITCRHEQGAGFIAQGYTRACGKIAPLMVTSGPGATNTVTPVADANMDSVPMSVVTGQVGLESVGTDAFQETDVVGLMYPITKHATLPDSVDKIAKNVGQLLHIADHGRKGPVCLDLPKNLQFETTENINIPEDLELPGLPPVPSVDEDSESVASAVELIKQSKRPVALVGHGVILSDSGKELVEFLETANIPAATTLHAVSAIPASHPLNLRMMGMHGEIEANRAIEESDLLIALGMRFDDRVTGKLSEYAKNAKVIHVEIDGSEIDKNVITDVQIHSDLKPALTALTKRCKQSIGEPPERNHFFDTIEKNRQITKNYYNHVFDLGVGGSGKLLMSRIVHQLSEFTGGKDNIIPDVGQHQMMTAKFYKSERFNNVFASGGLGTMGFGIPAAIGVKLARPDEEVWAIAGDGGVQMNIQELGTILQEGLNINLLIFNNSYLGMVRQWQDLFFENNHAQTPMISPDFEYIAKAYGLGYKKVEKLDEIDGALQWSKDEQRATIVEFICDEKEIVYPMVPPGFVLSDMIENEDDAKKKLNKK